MLPVQGMHGEVRFAVQAEPGSHIVIAQVIEQKRGPAQRGSRVTHGGNGMAEVMLDIPIGPDPILPTLAPRN